jgi:hypothetical protein
VGVGSLLIAASGNPDRIAVPAETQHREKSWSWIDKDDTSRSRSSREPDIILFSTISAAQPWVSAALHPGTPITLWRPRTHSCWERVRSRASQVTPAQPGASCVELEPQDLDVASNLRERKMIFLCAGKHVNRASALPLLFPSVCGLPGGRDLLPFVSNGGRRSNDSDSEDSGADPTEWARSSNVRTVD